MNGDNLRSDDEQPRKHIKFALWRRRDKKRSQIKQKLLRSQKTKEAREAEARKKRAIRAYVERQLSKSIELDPDTLRHLRNSSDADFFRQAFEYQQQHISRDRERQAQIHCQNVAVVRSLLTISVVVMKAALSGTVFGLVFTRI